jgi:hypothetical protein
MVIEKFPLETAGAKQKSLRIRIFAALPAGYQPGVSGLRQQAAITGAALVTNDMANTSAGSAVTTAGYFRITIPAGYRVGNITGNLPVAFQNSADSANLSTALVIGDSASDTTFLSSTELNANGTYIPFFGSATIKDYKAADYLQIKFTPTSGKALAALDTGLLDLEVFFENLADLSNS